MNGRVRVRRERPCALSVALALMITMLCVYLLTLGASLMPEASIPSSGDAPRVTEEVAFESAQAYFVALGRFDTAQEARIEAARYIPRGAAGYVVEDGETFLALGAAYQTEAEAARVAQSLSQTENLTCEVYSQSAERVRLRVTAQEEHIAAVQNAEALLRATAAQAAEIAFQLDRAEIDPEAARTLINIASGRLGDAHEALSAIPGAAQNSVCAQLLSLTERFQASLFVLSGENSNTTLSLSAKIKYNGIEVALGHMRCLRELNAL